ncbi:MAG: acetyl-CoA carboxylase biotin carboxyl carrier protein, partial [Burkholderiaceae bacterium]
MDLRKLKTLIDLVAESGIAEIEVTEGEDKVRIVKYGPPAAAPAQAMAPAYAAPAAPVAPAADVAAPAPETSGTKVPSPMVGTFYRSA